MSEREAERPERFHTKDTKQIPHLTADQFSEGEIFFPPEQNPSDRIIIYAYDFLASHSVTITVQ